MDDERLRGLLRGPESDRVERKRSFQNKDGILQAICAFANDLPGGGDPGILVLGLEDDGRCADLLVDDQLLRNLADLRTDGSLLPFPVLRVQRAEVDGCTVAVVLVEPADAPPMRLRGRTYVRVGPTTRQATAEEERRLSEKRRAKDLPFELHPVFDAKPTDLDMDLFRRSYLPAALPADILAENRRSEEQQLRSFRFLAGSGSDQPTVLGILTLGREPRRFLPGAYIQFLRIDGVELTDPIKDNKEIDGPLSDLLSVLDELLRVNISTAADFLASDREIRSPDYPLGALQQISRNAVLHRSYEGTHAPVRITWFSDRVEILSPGGPYGQVNPENFGESAVPDYRNPHLAEVLKNLGYVQRFGLGIPTAQKAMASNGNPAIEFEANPSHVLAVLRRREI